MRMHPHRSLFRVAACCVLACALASLAACSSLGTALLGNEYAFTAPQLQAQLDRRFPRDYKKLDGLVSLRIANPRLGIPPGSHRLRLDFNVGFGTLGREAVPSGHMAIASGLRFDPQTLGLHLDQPTLEDADFPGLGGAMNATGRELVDRWLEDYARNEPVYKLDNSLVERLGAQRITSTTIDDGRVVVHLGP
ncbi:MAG: DUF1439 domain-containing protein [Thermomonas sp.]